MTSGVLHTAGQVAGMLIVVASCACGNADTAAVKIAAPPTPTLVRIDLTPPTASIDPGGTVQFYVTPTWSGGRGTLPPIDYSATGGSITTDGLFTAGPAVGTYLVIAQVQGMA